MFTKIQNPLPILCCRLELDLAGELKRQSRSRLERLQLKRERVWLHAPNKDAVVTSLIFNGLVNETRQNSGEKIHRCHPLSVHRFNGTFELHLGVIQSDRVIVFPKSHFGVSEPDFDGLLLALQLTHVTEQIQQWKQRQVLHVLE